MIFICEPQCKTIDHEQVNSGFIYGLHLAYPEEKILFFAHTRHFEAIKNVLKNGKVPIDNIEHIPTNFVDEHKFYSIGGIISYYFTFKKIFNKILSLNTNKIFFLSNNPVILYTIKKLKQETRFKNISCTFVLHGELEDIANANYKARRAPKIKYSQDSNFKIKLIKLFNNPKKEILKKVLLFITRRTIEKIKRPFLKVYSQYSLIFKKIFRVKKMMMWQHSNHYHYIALSPHIVKNAKKYLDIDYLNFYTIIMPTIFTKPLPPADNQFIKFAVFGYGDSVQMYKMLTLLNKKKIPRPYEIRIISMDNKGTQEFPNITDIGQGKVLSRKDMEKALPDIDVFINLYDENRHRFGCSASIFEAFAYLKPVLHLSNDGYNYFNKPEKPIGFHTENLNEYVEKMCDMIENYPLYKNKLRMFRENMLKYREGYAIENNLSELRRTFTFG